MEARVTRAPLLLLLGLVLLLRLPFLNQAIQGDDHNYLQCAMHAQIDPLHPNDAQFLFLGNMVTMRGHLHPPLNGAFLGLLLWLFGSVREVPFHAAYILFSLIAAVDVAPGPAADASPDRFDGASAIVLCNADATCTGGTKCIDGRCTPPSELCADTTQCVVAGAAATGVPTVRSLR